MKYPKFITEYVAQIKPNYIVGFDINYVSICGKHSPNELTDKQIVEFIETHKSNKYADRSYLATTSRKTKSTN